VRSGLTVSLGRNGLFRDDRDADGPKAAKRDLDDIPGLDRTRRGTRENHVAWFEAHHPRRAGDDRRHRYEHVPAPHLLSEAPVHGELDTQLRSIIDLVRRGEPRSERSERRMASRRDRSPDPRTVMSRAMRQPSTWSMASRSAMCRPLSRPRCQLAFVVHLLSGLEYLFRQDDPETVTSRSAGWINSAGAACAKPESPEQSSMGPCDGASSVDDSSPKGMP
jgi:hypothetical protein